MIKKNLYAIYDTIAQDFLGGIMMDTHHAPVIRLFTELAARPDSKVGVHLADFELVCLGQISEQLELEGDLVTVLTGKKILEDREAAARRAAMKAAADVIAREA